ncbi:hypothetical protein [Puerhibacterium puerhi]|uniref:hypothetical protein n=1 Tax=Puerhibacterium puerhi TaxID=2692623 RepID=UPI00135AD254|nr:hypothetical protein [Puerhibacterium puerhi]
MAFESVSGPGVPEIGLISGADGASSLALEPGDYRALAECDSGAASATFTVDDQPLDVRLSL